ncbi:hypothetical protein [Mycolicibacterium vanbaalenii]|uniref:hypothetical protein n=1 Tax=Mycolicibacterium vanbaalenii TaxID=110539 RepID=UPI00132FB3C1|nr:hypothetical protein [Mycolicibacterium vanbaalenii]
MTRTESAPDSPISTQFTFSESDEHSFGIVETTLNGIAAYPLDEAVDRSIEGSRADREEHTGGPVTVSEIWRTTGNFDGAETREFGYQLIDGDEKTTVNSVLFYRDGNVVQAMVVYDGEADQEAVDRFLSSLASEPS